MTPNLEQVGEILSWDTDFFGCRIGRAAPGALTIERLDAIGAWAHEEEVECIYCTVEGGDAQSMRAAEARGLRLVDVRLDYSRPAAPVLPGRADRPTVAVARPIDRDALLPLLNEAFRQSRFFMDGGFPRERCEALYVKWLEESFGGAMGDVTLIAHRDGASLGFVTCSCDEETQKGRIGLVGVAASARGMGVGNALVTAAAAWLQDSGMSDVFVATQAWNVAAQRLYQRCGFTTHSATAWYHWWPSRA